MFQKKLGKAFTTTIIIGLIMSLAAFQGWADTPVRGVIDEDTTWTADGNDYIMTGSIIIDKGATLTIEPNVIIKVDGEYSIRVYHGGLVARGTETKPITFTTTSGNPVPGSWGYISFEDASFDGSILQHCIVEYAGCSGDGAIWADSASPFIDNCVIHENANHGLYLKSSASVISNNEISGNSADDNGGGIYIYSSDAVTISGNTIFDNSADDYGGGIYISYSDTVTISDNTISGNSADDYSGGIYIYSSTVTINDNTISGNSADDNGGGINIYSSSGTVEISGNKISDNTISGSHGAAVYTKSSGPFTNNTITNNKAEGGGNTNAVFIDATPAFNYNSFGLSLDDIPTELALYYNQSYGSDLDATNTWWGTTDEKEIDKIIYDFYDDPTKAFVDYEPYLLAPPGAPAPPEGLMITVADSIVTLNWTANTEPDLAGYQVYYGQNEGGPYDGTGAAEGDSPIDVGDVTTATVSGLPVDSATYYFVVTAYDDEVPPDGPNESYFSNEVSNNNAPQTPTNQSPADGAEDVALIPTFEADAFFDTDGDGHAASQWQVDVEGGGTVYDSGEDTVNLTSITLPIALGTDETYKWHVRYLDSRGRWSQYSATTAFTTFNPPTIVCKTDKPIYKPLESVQVLADVDNPGDSFSANLLGGIIVVRTPPKKTFILKGEVVTEKLTQA